MKRVIDDGDILGLALQRQKSKDEEDNKGETNTGETKKAMVEKTKIPVNQPGWVIEVDKLTKEQILRYMAWKKVVFYREHILEMISPYTTRTWFTFGNIHISMVSTCAKMLVGDLVEEAIISRIDGDTASPIQPQEIVDSYRKLYRTRRALPDYSPILKRRNYKIPKPVPEEDDYLDRMHRVIFRSNP